MEKEQKNQHWDRDSGKYIHRKKEREGEREKERDRNLNPEMFSGK